MLQHTKRQQQVAEGLLKGHRTDRIARDMGISPRSIKEYINKMVKRNEIDPCFIPQVRIVYLEAQKTGLLSPHVVSQLEGWSK